MGGRGEQANARPGHFGKILAATIFTILAGLETARASIHCAEPPPAVRNMTADTFYVDRPRSIMDARTVRRNEDSLRRLDDGLTSIIEGADVALRKNSETAGRCSALWLATWARDGAMLGRMGRPQAEYERKWRTAGIAIAYLKLKAFATSEQRATIETWLLALAQRVGKDRASHDSHRNWAALVQTAVGVATGGADPFESGRQLYDEALRDIASDGSLHAEMQRAGRALHYHNYALAPLVMMAELAALRGEDWYARAGGAIHRLVGFTVAGLNDPVTFSARAGAPVDLPRDGILAWVSFYGQRFPDRFNGINPFDRFNYYWLGGDTTATLSLWSRARAG